MRVWLIWICLCCSMSRVAAQDTTSYKGMHIALDEVVVQAQQFGFDVEGFIKRVTNDTSFYQAFKNLRLLSHQTDNSITVWDKKRQNKQASYHSKTTQTARNGCRWMVVDEEQVTGDFYKSNKRFRYYTAELYAHLFFTKDTVCVDEVGSSKGRMAKHKSQLKALLFNPGKPIGGVPIIGSKVAVFDADLRRYYNYQIQSANYQGSECWVFRVEAKPNLNAIQRAEIVYDKLITYFDKNTMDILGRDFALSYKTLVFDFNVQMQVQLLLVDGLLVPSLIQYNGTWDVPTQKRETAQFTGRFYDFK
jgi:hypothetical protein